MSRSTRHFLDLLDVELADICADLREMEDLMRVRIDARDLTPYVYQENTALLELEIACITRLRIAVRNASFPPDTDLDAAAREISRLCAEETQRTQMPPAICIFVNRRITRVLQYLNRQEPAG